MKGISIKDIPSLQGSNVLAVHCRATTKKDAMHLVAFAAKDIKGLDRARRELKTSALS